ncbi:MAG: hypothetical protein COB97_05175, partial [Paracoccus sp.]
MRALILGASGGIGAAVAARLRDGGADVTGLSRSGDGLDLTDAATLSDHATRLDGQRFDLIFNATGALMIDGSRPEKSFDAADADLDYFQYGHSSLWGLCAKGVPPKYA